MTSLLMWFSSHLQGKQLPITRNKATYFYMHISFSEFIIPLCCRYQVVQSCTCKEYSKNIKFIATSPYYNNPTTYTSCESLRNIILDCITSYNQRRYLQITSQSCAGLALQLVLTKAMARAMAMFLAWD